MSRKWFLNAPGKWKSDAVPKVIIERGAFGQYIVTWFEEWPTKEGTRYWFVGAWETAQAAEEAALLVAEQARVGIFVPIRFRGIVDAPLDSRPPSHFEGDVA